MKCGPIQERFLPSEAFDMTPIIDVVFLLIIFFMLVCQFIAAENFQVNVPEQIGTAQQAPPEQDLMTTVTVMKNADGLVQYAVGGDILASSEVQEVPGQIAVLIDRQLRLLNPQRRVIRLRCDKSLPFGKVKYALKGISQSSATDIQWAVFQKD